MAAQAAPPGADLAERIGALETAVREGTQRLDTGLLADAARVAARAAQRGGFSAQHTVVALAGATGSGKSSVFNALAGQPIAATGVRRPTTSHALAATWGPGFGPLLDWLAVPAVHEVAADGPLAGLVLLDLPDYDSVVAEHRVRADRLIERADLLVWVVDPQKYADAALHERYLRPLTGRSDVVVVVLNQADRLSPADTDTVLADLRRLVDADGLATAQILPVSAVTDTGIADLRSLLAHAVATREAATRRLALDIAEAAERIAAACGVAPSARSQAQARTRLLAALADAAGVPTVTDAVRVSTLKDARAATGWPVTRWIGKLRADPLRRLGLKRGANERRPATSGAGSDSVPVTSMPTGSPGVRAAAASAVRAYADEATAGAPDMWVLAARQRASAALDPLPDALDRAVAGTRLEAQRRPRWWGVVGTMQWLIFVPMIAGLAWLGLGEVFAYFHLPRPRGPVLTIGATGATDGTGGAPGTNGFDVPWATLLAIGGAVLGLALALVSRLIAAVGARRRAAHAHRRLTEAVALVAQNLVCDPVSAEIDAMTTVRLAALAAAGGPKNAANLR